ncbi:MAG: stage V sporulation protein AD [Clostridia bacterium]
MKIGKQTLKLVNTPKLYEATSAVGPKESSGPLGIYFDIKCSDVFYGEKSFEKAESKFMKSAIDNIICKLNLSIDRIDYIFGGDLLNQCIASGYCMRDFAVPYFGLYGACSTYVESIILASILINSNCGEKIIATASSHFCSAERQFRLPLEHGNQKAPTAQYTVTGAGAALIVNKNLEKKCPLITYVTPGKIVDMGIKDISNMGAAMAPAAFDTIITHLQDTKREPDYYDAIITGDLGKEGTDILIDLCINYGMDISKVHRDCGKEIFDLNDRDINSGGSGCGCIATVFSSYFYQELKEKKLNKILLVATGALMSPISIGQGESIPSIAHAVAIENEV